MSLRIKKAVLALCVFFPAGLQASAADYHISYLWHPDLATVEAYKKKVAGQLGLDMSKRLRVVRGQDNYGLVYPRKGGLESARTVAARHSRLLAARGLDAAVAVPASDWRDALAALPVAAEPAAPSAPAASAASLPAKKPSALSGLGDKVESYIKGLRRKRIVQSDERTAWSVYDFTSGEKLVSINEEVPMSAASMIKPFVALAWLHEAEAGRKNYGAEERRRMENMIRDSGNVSTSRFMRDLGGPAAVQRLLKSNYPGIFQQISIVEYIPANGRTYRNRASARDYSRFLYAVWKDEVKGSAEIKRLMGLSKPNRLYTSVPEVPEDTEVMDKTGSTARLCGDMGIMVARDADGNAYPYIIVGMIEKSRPASGYAGWMRSRGNVIRAVSGMVYEELSAAHGFGPASVAASGGEDGAGPDADAGGS
ncbi:MAG: serine hydrolase [Elusimicrobiales bacterium]|nr:serine hydrolase [Elusimicrobiales bacterium]